MESCVVCLEPNADIFSHIGIDTNEWKALNIQRIVEKHLWWWYLKKPTNNSVPWICRQCWQELSSFHNFYIKVENEHNQFMKKMSALKNDTENELLTVKRESPVFYSGDTLTEDTMPLEKRKRGRKKKAAENIEQVRPAAVVIKNENELFVAQNMDKTNIEYEDVESNGHYENTDVMETSESLNDIWEPDIHSNSSTESEDDIWEPDIHSNNNTDSEDEEPRQRKPKTKNVTKRKNKDAKKQKPYSKNEIREKTEVSKKNDEFLAENQFELTCSLCKVPLINFSELKSHYRDEHDILGHVMCCDRKFFKRDLLVDHLRVHKDPNYFKCPQCDRTLANRENFENHIEYHKESKEPQELTFNCDKCEKSFFNKVSLERHQLLHMEEHAGATSSCETCNLCGEKPTNKIALREHINIKHKEEILLEQKCPYCSRISVSVRALRQHIKYAHTMERKYPCHMCDKSFKRPVELREHLSTHTGEPLYTCSYCPRTFFSNSNKHTHRKLAHRKEWEEDRLKNRSRKPLSSGLNE